MKTVHVNTGAPYNVFIGKGILRGGCAEIIKAMPCEKYLVVTDSGVPEKYRKSVLAEMKERGADCSVYVMLAGEENKNLHAVEGIINRLSSDGFNRQCGVIALGGGVVGDTAGLAAALFMRGIPYAQIPTTLLAAIDSSVGGKTGVDTPFGKNMIGAFYQPMVVLCDVEAFYSLDKKQTLCGMGEGLKYAFLQGGKIFEEVSHTTYDETKKCLISHKNGKIEDFDYEGFVAACVEMKAEIVTEDERENGTRKFLNFGHTFGHAIEKLSGYSLGHGECVAKGIVKIAETFPEKFPRGFSELAKEICCNIGLDHLCKYSAEELSAAVYSDKKSSNGGVSMVFLKEIGEPYVENISFEEIYARLQGEIKINKGKLFGSVNAVPSKAYLHRALICAALCDGPTEIFGKLGCDDVFATLSCLRALGAEIETEGEIYSITPIKRAKTAYFNCNESGSTLRFLLPVAAALGGEYIFDGCGNLQDRPVLPLLEALEKHGIKCDFCNDSRRLPLKISGKLTGGEFRLSGGISSQFVSGLLLAAPIVGEDVKITLTDELKSKNYVDITINLMQKFGVDVEVSADGFFVKGGQRYVSPKRFSVEGDWSSAAVYIACGLLCGNVSVTGLNAESLQGDKAFLKFANAMHGDIEFKEGAFIARESLLCGGNFNVENAVDIAPVLAVTCAFASGKSVISGVNRLKLKESDRLAATIDLINAIGGRAVLQGDSLVIEGGVSREFTYKSSDHRMIAAAAVAGARCGGHIYGANSVKKSEPQFFETFKSLGGDFDAV